MTTTRSAAELLTDAARAVRNDADIPREELAQLLDGMGAYWSDHVCDSDCDRGGRKCEDLPLGRLAKAILGEVEPPLPPEPHADGSFVTVDSPGNKEWAFSRQQGVHRSMFPKASMLDDYWWWHDNGDWVTWKQICGMGAPKVLVPDPVQDAPELPFRLTDKGMQLIQIDQSGDNGAVIEVPSATRFDASELTRIAGACLRAARSGASS